MALSILSINPQLNGGGWGTQRRQRENRKREIELYHLTKILNEPSQDRVFKLLTTGSRDSWV